MGDVIFFDGASYISRVLASCCLCNDDDNDGWATTGEE